MVVDVTEINRRSRNGPPVPLKCRIIVSEKLAHPTISSLPFTNRLSK